MKTKISILFAVAAFFIAHISFAQKAQTVKLDQAPGVFTTTSLNLKAGTYIFEITNAGVDHEVGFVIAPKGKTEQENHITAAYVQKTIKDGESSTSNEVKLTKGEYVYFCPMNPTPLYTLVVE